MNLMASLGLDQVSGNPNEIADNTYDGIVEKDELVYVAKTNSINHAITYKVTEGTFAGKTKSVFVRFGTNPVDANGQATTDPNAVAGFDNTMSDDNRNYYKADLLALGVPVQVIDSGQFQIGSLKDTPCTFTLKTKDGYQNVYNVKRRTLQPTAQPGTLPQSQPAANSVPQAAQTQAQPASIPANLI